MKYRYFVKYMLEDGSVNVKIIQSQDPERIWLSEVKAEIAKTDSRQVKEILKCRHFNEDNNNLEPGDLVY